MRAALLAIAAVGACLATPDPAAAQRLPPLRPPPVSLTVPHPIPPITTTPGPPKDLYQQITPPRPAHPIVVYPGYGYGYGYGYGSYLGSTDYIPPVDPLSVARPAAPTVPRGGLLFETVPGAAQVYVDSYYVGVIQDFGTSGRALDLDAGPHRIELRATDYATLAFSVNIEPYQTLHYRGDLARIAAPPPAAAAAPAAPGTTYVIAHCYAGNRPPTRPLPSGCDIKQLQTRN